MLCLGFLAGVPAIICGHMAHKRARQSPERFGGAGLAIAGFVMGYASVVITLLLIAIFVPGLMTAKSTSEDFRCVNNLKQIGLSFRVWAVDNGDKFPFNVSTNSGGTLELKNSGADGFEKDPALHFQVLSNELSTPVILWCPGDKSKSAVADFESLGNENVSYQLRVGEEINDSNPGEVLAVCPIHNNLVRCDGSVQRGSESPANKPRKLGKSRKSPPGEQ
jgi:hypothetical protein